MAAGWTHSLFLTASGQVKVVGFNGYGQLGLGYAAVSSGGTYNRQPQTIQFGGNHLISQVATNQAGFHSVFRTTTGRVFATGRNDQGQLGSNDLCAAALYVDQ